MAGKGRATFVWDDRELRINTEKFPERVDAMVAATMQLYVARGESMMKTGAKWHDRTGNARNSLHAVATRQGSHHELILAHGMSYGIWLEVRWAGKYAIILPTLSKIAPMIMTTLGKGMSRLGSAL